VVSIQAVNNWKIYEHVPLEGTISYKELSQRVGFPESKLRRLLRYSMTQRIFQEPEINQVAHSPASRAIATDPNMRSFISLFTESYWPVMVHTLEAFEKWPESYSPKETAAAAWKGSETTWFEVVAESKPGIPNFRQAMKMVSEGEGWEDSHLAENYPWETFGSGTVVDVRVS
jgi:hypothetical protein